MFATTVANETATEIILRCGKCGNTFVLPRQGTRKPHYTIIRGTYCPECAPPKPIPTAPVPSVSLVIQGRIWNPNILSKPTQGTKSYKLYKLMLEGTHPYDAAETVKVAGPTAEKVYWRYVYPEITNKRIKELEAQISSHT